MNLDKTIRDYHKKLSSVDRSICEILAETIQGSLKKSENKIWHAHPVWFLNGNPVVGYSKLKNGIRVLFWSGQSFPTPGLISEGTFKAAEIRYTDPKEIKVSQLKKWLKDARNIQWDYENIVKHKGVLYPIKGLDPNVTFSKY